MKIHLLSLGVVSSVCLMYLVTNLILPRSAVDAVASLYLVQPILWIVITLYIIAHHSVDIKLHRNSETRNLYRFAVLAAVCQVILYLLGGLFTGFGKNSAHFTITGTVGLAFYLATSTLGIELCRAWLIKRISKDQSTLALIFVSLLFTILNIPLMQLINLKPEFGILSQSAFKWLPILMESMLATAMALQFSARAAIIYRGILITFWFFCPILPNLDVITKSFIGIIAPVAALIVLNNQNQSRYLIRQARFARGSLKDFSAGWVVSGTAAFIIMWFSFGLLAIQPLVVASGSMSPTLNIGDVVIVAETPADSVRMGDILVFQDDALTVMHRVIQINEIDGTRLFTTRGDANNSADVNPIKANHVAGRVLFSIPRIGWVSLKIKELF